MHWCVHSNQILVTCQAATSGCISLLLPRMPKMSNPIELALVGQSNVPDDNIEMKAYN